MAIPSIHNLLARLDSTFNKESSDTNFYQLLQMVAHEIDAARRELQFTQNDNYFYQVRDDQLFSNLGVLLKVNKQPFFTKRTNLSVFLKITIDEDFDSKPKCLTSRLAKVTVEWTTELSSTSEADYTVKSPFIIPSAISPSSDIVNKTGLKTTRSNPGKNHKTTILGLDFSSDLFLRVRSVNQVGEARQSEFIRLRLPDIPFVGPIVTTESPVLEDLAGNTIRVPLDDDPFGLRHYRKILYGVLTSYLTGPTLKGVAAGLQPFFDLPVEIIENFRSIPDLYETNAIEAIDEILVHTFGVNVILDNTENSRNLGELNDQVQGVLEFIKPAHTLPFLRFVIPDHFFCPADNPFGVKGALALEPMQGPCGEKVFINPTPIDLGATAYYEDVLGYRIYCDYSINYFGSYCGYYGSYGYNQTGHELIPQMHGYFDVLDRNYFYIQNGQRLVICPFVKSPAVELFLEHRNGIDPDFVRISGDVNPGANTFQNIPFSQRINVVLTKGNGSKIVHVTFIYPEQAKTNTKDRKLNEARLGSGCHGEITVDAVTYLLNTLPTECCSEEYIADTTVTDIHTVIEEDEVLNLYSAFRLNDASSALNSSHLLMPAALDNQIGTPGDNCLMTNVFNRRLNDTDVVLGPECIIKVAEIDVETLVCDDLQQDIMILNAYETIPGRCNSYPRVLNRSVLTDAHKEIFSNPGFVVATEYVGNEAFILNGVESYNDGTERFFNISLTNYANSVMAPINRFDLEPWNPHLVDRSTCEPIKPACVECS